MRILFVARPYSVHAVRWIMQLQYSGWDVHVFPATAHPSRDELRGVVLHDGWRCALERVIHVDVRWPVHRRGVERIRRMSQGVARLFPSREQRLARVIRKIKPDIVHSLEMQHAGYLTLASKERIGGTFPPWIVQNWGSDIYLFQHLCGHREHIRRVLTACDFYDCECERDIELARLHGFQGTVLPVIPNGGGYDLALAAKMRSSEPPSRRRIILIKGYQGWAGRAHVAIAALYKVVDILQGYTVKIYSALTEDVHIAGQAFASRTGIPVEFVPPVSHSEMLRLHGQARVSVGLSISDSISTSLLEAMIMGSFPIQSDTSVADEWIANGQSGIVVPSEDPCAVADALRKALTDDELVDRAAKVNEAATKSRLEGSAITRKVLAMYEDVFRMAHEARGVNPEPESATC